jgi:malate dehydrogenase (quinone)
LYILFQYFNLQVGFKSLMSKVIKSLVPKTDVVLIGAGIMSATLGIILKELDPEITIQLFEKLDQPGTESSDAWNNAGTGHSAFCELNYTPQKADGSIDISKAIKICEDYEVSREFWAYLVEKGYVKDPASFIRTVPHVSFVWGKQNITYLEKRYQQLTNNVLFRGMQYTDDRDLVNEWAPLIMNKRESKTPVAATSMSMGTDVDFGSLTRQMIDKLASMPGVTVHHNIEVEDIDPYKKGGWIVETKNMITGKKEDCLTKFVFIGAGGATLHLLKDAEIKERKGYGGFPVSGLWLKCNNEELINMHSAKVYGKAPVGAPPMSVPHVDTRIIDGKKELLFGPFAGFSTRFLKSGSRLDLAKSFRVDNVLPMISAGLRNVPLTKYLIEQVRLSHEDRVEALKEYVPSARKGDWELKQAGQRVQVIKKDEGVRGKLEFGTEAVVSADGSVAALLGASPGASTAAAIMFSILPKCFGKESKSEGWKTKLKEMSPSFGVKLSENENLLQATRERTSKVLRLH